MSRYVTRKQQFGVEMTPVIKDILKQGIALHPVLKRLPPQDREAAAHAASQAAMIAIRSSSISDVIDEIEHEVAMERVKAVRGELPEPHQGDAEVERILTETAVQLADLGGPETVVSSINILRAGVTTHRHKLARS